MNFEIKEICSKLNYLRKEYFDYRKDNLEKEGIKQQIQELLNLIPEGEKLGQVFQERVSYWTSYGGHTDEYTKVLKYTKSKNNMWINENKEEKDVTDMVMSVLHNSTDILPYKRAVEVAKIEKQNDKNHFTSYAVPEANIYTKSEISLPNSLSSESFVEQMNLIEELFYNYMTDKDYSVRINNEDDIPCLGYGGRATKGDKFAMIFNLTEQSHPRSFSIHAIDRNGHFALTGETAAIYSVSVGKDTTVEELKDKFSKLLSDIYEKYGVYSKENRLDFVYNELETERKDYTYNLDGELEI